MDVYELGLKDMSMTQRRQQDVVSKAGSREASVVVHKTACWCQSLLPNDFSRVDGANRHIRHFHLAFTCEAWLPCTTRSVQYTENYYPQIILVTVILVVIIGMT